MGVPGLALWVAVQVTWVLAILNAYYKSRRKRDARWSGLFLFLGAFWLAFLINASFDVYLEGPMGGIWFWTVYGTGVGASGSLNATRKFCMTATAAPSVARRCHQRRCTC